jgi:hypothetical protein
VRPPLRQGDYLAGNGMRNAAGNRRVAAMREFPP